MPKLTDLQDTDRQNDPYSSDAARELIRQDTEAGRSAGVSAGIDQAEAFANDPANASKKALSEESDVTNRFNFSQSNDSKTPTKGVKARLKNFAKKKGPFAFLGGGLAGILALIAFFGGPSMLLVHMSEIFGDKLDQQNIVLDKRYRKISLAKFENNTRGLCSNAVSFRCKYGSFSNRELRAMHKNGISVVGADGKPFVDKDGKVTRERGTRAASIQFDGKTITPQGYQRELRTNPSFRTASILSTNTKFIGLSDKIAGTFLTTVRSSKARPFKEGATDKERNETLINDTKNGVAGGNSTLPERPNPCEASCQQQYDDDKARYDNAIELSKKADEFATNNVRTSEPGMMSKTISAANALGAADDVCTIAGAINGVGYGAKIIRKQQMIRYAMKFLVLGSMIKAGDATPPDTEFLGEIATKTTVNEQTGETTKAATDSFAFRNAAYGDTGLTESAGLALGAAGLGSALQGIAGQIYEVVDRDTCKTLNNPLVQTGGVLLTIVPGVGAASKAAGVGLRATINAAVKKMVVSAGGAFAEGLAMSALLGYITNIGLDIVSGAGADPDSLYGETAGDWIGSGTDAMFSGMNGMGGALPLTPAQAVAQTSESRQIAAEYNRAEGEDTSPFDTTNPNSFIGSVYQNALLRSSGSFSSLPSSLSSIGNLVTSTLTGAGVSKTHASESDFTQCEDYTYRDSANGGKNQVATSPLCHVTRGIPAPYIDLDPLVVSEDLFAKNQIDETGLPIGDDYKQFIQLCFTDRLVNEVGLEGDVGDEGKCQIRDSDSQAEKDRKGYYAVHYVDERLSEVAENGLPKSGVQQPAERADTSTEFAWPLDKKYFTQDPEDWLGPHFASSGTYTNGIDSLASDIGNPPDGSPVYAMYGGRVTRPDLGGHGLIITSEVQGGKLEIAYAHGPRTNNNTTYKTGDKIMEVGCLGNCSGGHLHVDMSFNDKPVCPQDVFSAFNKGSSPNFAELTKTAKAPCGRGRDGAV